MFSPQDAAAQDVLATKAVTAILVDQSSNTLLYAKAPDQPFEPGSLAKVMTAAAVFDALKAGEVTPETLYTVSEHAWRTGGAPSRGATMFASVKSQIAISDLLQGLIVHNANDAAIVLAEGLAGSEEAFAERMNALATRLGMKNTHFANPTGYPAPGAKVTARDLSLLAGYILSEHKDRYGLFSQPEFTWNNIFQRAKNPFLGNVTGLDGLGAGQSEPGGFSGLVSVERDGRRVIAALSGLPSDKARLASVKDLVEGAWDAFTLNRLFDAGAQVASARVFGGTAGEVPLVAAQNVDVLLPNGGTMNYRLRAVYEGPLIAPVEKGALAGEIRVLGPDDAVVYRAPLLTGSDIREGTLSQRAMNGVRQLLFGWL
ncbi:D-alanyl-D-alanine carboxypeptidase family protein [Pannonibacter sp. Pt2]|uniref:serine-type D-Ala-D-Ala carboxypeptidase n=1 Tax=Pannonibacter anstelovis TaxID=3121537 RepID=A0ABU7ZIE6_9HYPH